MKTNWLKYKRVLIVDDEPDVLETLEELLAMRDVAKASSFETPKSESRCCRVASFHPEMALFRNLLPAMQGMSGQVAGRLRQSAGLFVRSTICTPPRNALISLIL